MSDKTIVVLGGSFNPPTKAHVQLLESAVKQLGAEFGVFVPSSMNYVLRKMSKQKWANQVYSETERSSMLNDICKEHPLLRVDTCEFGDDGRGHTYDTLCKIQELYPDYKILFVIGADKLSIIPKWHKSEQFFERFEFAVTHRDDIDMTGFILGHPVLSKYKDIFHEITVDGDMSDISSSAVRKCICNKDWKKLKELVCGNTMKYLM